MITRLFLNSRNYIRFLKLKIALILSAPPGYSETFFSNKIRILERSGHSILLYVDQRAKDSNYRHKTGYSSSERKFEFNHFLSFGIAGIRLISNLPRSFKLYRLNRKDGFSVRKNIRSLLICSHIIGSKANWLYFGFATIAIDRENLAKAIGAKMAVSIRGYDISIYPVKYPGCYDLLWKRIDGLHYISDDLLKLAIENGLTKDINRKKITPAIDTALFKSNSLKKLPSDGKIKILTVARLSWKKGIVYTLRSLSILKKKGLSFTYTIVGNGIERERIIYAIDELGLTEDVNLTGSIDQSKIADLLNNTDLYIQYSVQEGFCNAVLEAQSAGCICIVSDAGGLPENVIHEQTGWVVPKRNPVALAEQIEAILRTDTDELMQIKNAAVNRVQEEFNLEKQRKEFIEFYS